MKKKLPQNSPQDQHKMQDDPLLQGLNEQFDRDQKLREKTHWDERKNNERLALVSSLLLLSVTTVVQLISISTLDETLYIAMICFSIAIPLLILSALVENWQRIHKRQNYYNQNEQARRLFLINISVAGIIDILGFFMVFMHFDYIIGILFGFTAVLALIIHNTWTKTRDNPT